MHCPNCGAEASVKQKFCRACGFNLERFAQLFAEPLPDLEDKDVAKARRRLRQLESATKLTGWVVVLGGWLLLASVMAGIGVNAIVNGGNIVGGALLLGIAVGSIAVEGLLVYYASLYAKASSQKANRPAASSVETTNKLLPEDQSLIAMSVAEQTTARLQKKIEPHAEMAASVTEQTTARLEEKLES